MARRPYTFLEFFAGGGFARMGLGADWKPLFVNDFDPRKRDAYGANFGLENFNECDITSLTAADMPTERADLAWASFPCQDLSLAGARAGLSAKRSGVFHDFMRLMRSLKRVGRAPRIIAIENVTGLLSSNNGADFATVVSALGRAGYKTSAMVIDALAFTPQSRPRLFIFGFAEDDSALSIDTQATEHPCAPSRLINAVAALPASAHEQWIWLDQIPANRRNTSLAEIIEHDIPWDDTSKTTALINQMAPRHQSLIADLKTQSTSTIGTAFRRMRIEHGEKVVRIEPRFDGVAGCLRTPSGGSSRQILLSVGKGAAHSRLITPREAARLMGAPDDYILPGSATTALKVCGDGVCPPIVAWLAETLFEPALRPLNMAA